MTVIRSREGYDIGLFETELPLRPKRMLVVLADVDKDGLGAYEAEDLDYEGLPRLHVRSKRNSWYHEKDLINDLKELVPKNLEPVFVGARVGGYAAAYLSIIFKALAICFSPFASRSLNSVEETLFNEKQLLHRVRKVPALIFFDPKISGDRVNALALNAGAKNVLGIEVPYCGSPSKVALRESGVSRRVLEGLVNGAQPNVKGLQSQCRKMYSSSPHGIAFRLREEGSVDEIAHYLNSLSDIKNLDAGQLYYLTDLYLACGLEGEAVRCALLSIEKRAGSAAVLRASATIEKVEGISAALLFLGRYSDVPSLQPAVKSRLDQLLVKWHRAKGKV